MRRISHGHTGSGKTTLLKRIIQNDDNLKIAVIQNEFSEEMGIESPVIKDSVGPLLINKSNSEIIILPAER